MNNRSLRYSLVAIAFLLSAPAFAGHGFVTTFGDVEWLPEPGRTPDSTWYQLDAWHEAGQLWLASTPQETVELSLGFAKEKLAETEAMLMASNTNAAQIAVDQYWHYVDQAEQAIPEGESKRDEASVALIETLTKNLLEHQYILTIIHTDLPTGSRSVLRDLFTTAQKRYPTIADRLPRKKRGALFFKEEEVRWAIEMAMREDEEAG